MSIFSAFDFIALCAICWTAFAALEGGNEVINWRRTLLAVSLIGVMVSSFIGAIVVAMEQPQLRWFVRGILYFGTLFAFWFYDRRFGVGRHLRMAGDCAAQNFAALRRWINRRRGTK